MAELKTKATAASAEEFLNSVEDSQRRQDAFAIVELMREVTGDEPKMWGAAIVGFGRRRYKYPDGREMDWMLTAFSPRKQNLTLYISGGFDTHAALMAKLGKHGCGKGCLYIKRLADVDLDVLRDLIRASAECARSGSD